MAIEVRALTVEEVPRVWTIDRREYIANIYRRQDGELVLEPHDFEVPGWRPGQEESDGARFVAVLARGGVAWAVLDEDAVVAATVVDVKPVGAARDLIKLDWLFVSRDYRACGLGGVLIERAKAFAREHGAAGLYISATPSENTVKFYLGRGANLVAQPDPELFAYEPEDIHLELRL